MMYGPLPSSTALSMRGTLPDIARPGMREQALIARGVKPCTGRPNSVAKRLVKCNASVGMSRAAREGRQEKGQDIEAEIQILAKPVFATSETRSWLLAAMIRTLARRKVSSRPDGIPFPAKSAAAFLARIAQTADLVEEQGAALRSAMSPSRAACAVVYAPRVWRKLGLDQLHGNRAAVHRTRGAKPRRKIVDRWRTALCPFRFPRISPNPALPARPADRTVCVQADLLPLLAGCRCGMC